MSTTRNIFISIALALTTQLHADIKLPSIISDGMVLQQQSEAKLWGWSTTGSQVSVKTSWGETSTATVQKDGQWSITVNTPEATLDDYTLTLSESGSTDTKTLKVHIGEVWLASGQSNMEMPLKGFGGACVKNGALDAMRARQESPLVRMFNVERKQLYTPQDDCRGNWMEPTFSNAMEFSATAYYFASALSNALGVYVGIINCSYGGSRVESWSSAKTCSEYPDVPTDSISIFQKTKATWERALVTYNAMFHPIRHYTCKGIIWYQGCSNVGNNEYAYRLKRMVDQWRGEMQQGNLPFYQVQIAPYIYGANGDETAAARLREQQELSCNMIENSAFVCTYDLVEPNECHNIHPKEKRTVGVRLSLLALNKTYGMTDIACEGPRYDPSTFKVEGNSVTVGFKTNNMGICSNYGLEGFEIAGSDRVFHKAETQFNWRTNTVTLTAPEVNNPVAVRYCFKDFPTGNVFGGNELPLVPFRTDDW